MRYVTTNIRLEAEVYARLKLRSARERKSLSQLVREAVARAYDGEGRSRGRPRAFRRDALFRLVGICDSGVRDGSVEHDRYLYGRRRS
jgi:hypothetical protein